VGSSHQAETRNDPVTILKWPWRYRTTNWRDFFALNFSDVAKDGRKFSFNAAALDEAAESGEVSV
jgi:hypothetical protein